MGGAGVWGVLCKLLSGVSVFRPVFASLRCEGVMMTYVGGGSAWGGGGVGDKGGHKKGFC